MNTIALVETLKRISRSTSKRGTRQRELIAAWIERELERRAMIATLRVCREAL